MIRVLDSYDGLPVFRSHDGRQFGVTSLQIMDVKNIHIRKVGEVAVVQFGVEYSWRAFLFQFSHMAFASKRLRDDNDWLAEYIEKWLRENVPYHKPCAMYGDDKPVVVNVE